MRYEKGFTLIEVMIVVAIIGILAAILIPAITGEPYTIKPDCRNGYQFDRQSGMQIIGANGGGIQCGLADNNQVSPH